MTTETPGAGLSDVLDDEDREALDRARGMTHLTLHMVAAAMVRKHLAARAKPAPSGDDQEALALTDEHLLFSYLDEYLNANGEQPEVVGYDRDDRAFFAWLDEEGGDCVGLRVCVLGAHEGRAEVSSPGEIEAPGQGEVSSLRYPIRATERRTDPPAPSGEEAALERVRGMFAAGGDYAPCEPLCGPPWLHAECEVAVATLAALVAAPDRTPPRAVVGMADVVCMVADEPPCPSCEAIGACQGAPLPPVPDLREAVAAALLTALMDEYGEDEYTWTALRSLQRVTDAVLAIPAIATALGEQP